jgi:hypothetical protein
LTLASFAQFSISRSSSNFNHEASAESPVHVLYITQTDFGSVLAFAGFPSFASRVWGPAGGRTPSLTSACGIAPS